MSRSILPSSFATFCSAFLGVNWFLPRLGAVLAAQGITPATVHRVSFGRLSMRRVNADGKLVEVDTQYELRDLPRIAGLIATLAGSSKRCMLAKVRPEFELMFHLRDGSQRHFRVTDRIVRPDVPGSALSESWLFPEGALTPFLPPEDQFPRRYRAPRPSGHDQSA